MAKKENIVVALDIGSDSIKMAAASRNFDDGSINILSYKERKSSGIRRGVVVNVLEVADIISSLKEEIENDIGQELDSVYTNINGSHLFAVHSRGLVSVSRADQKISDEDIERVLEASKSISLSPNKEIIDVYPKNFIVDGEEKVKKAVGLQGVRLEAETIVFCGFSPYINNSNKAVLNAGFRFNTLIPNHIADANSILSPQEKELGVCLLDIGAGTTNMAVFEEGNLIHMAVFPVGSSNITNDLAICLKTSIDTAEKVKIDFGFCGNNKEKRGKRKQKGEERKIKISTFSEDENGEEKEEILVFPKKILIDIIKARVSEIFELVSKELKSISRHKLLPAGVVITGGGAKMAGIKEIAKKELKLPARIGIPQISQDFENDLRLATIWGLILEAIEIENFQEKEKKFSSGVLKKVKKIFNLFTP